MDIIENSIIQPLPNDNNLKQEEKFWHIELPVEYKDFIKKYNGGIPAKNILKTINREYVVERFLCILNNSNEGQFGIYDIDVVLTQIEDRLTNNENLIGVELLPIAILFSGDFVCLDYKTNKENPTICVWSHEESSELSPVSYYVTNNFGEFLAMLSS